MYVDAQRCPQNHRCPCIGVCPVGAFHQKGVDDLPVIDAERCTGCGVCVQFCPQAAVIDGE